MYHKNISMEPIPDSLINEIKEIKIGIAELILNKFITHLTDKAATLYAGTYIYKLYNHYDPIFSSSSCHAQIMRYADYNKKSTIKEITTIYDGTLPAAEEYLSWLLSPDSPWKDLFEVASITVFTSGNRITSINIKPNECYYPLLMNFLIALRAIKEFNKCIQSWNTMVKDYKIHPAYAFFLCRFTNIKNNSWLLNGYMYSVNGIHWPLNVGYSCYGLNLINFKNGIRNEVFGRVMHDSGMWLSDSIPPLNLDLSGYTMETKTKFSKISNILDYEKLLKGLEERIGESIYV